MKKLIATVFLLASTPAFASTSESGPVYFTPNVGQADPQVRFVGVSHKTRARFEDRQVHLSEGDCAFTVHFERPPVSGGKSGAPKISGEAVSEAKANFIRGDARAWRTGLPLYRALRYSGLWRGIDVVYSSQEGALGVDYLLAPGSDVTSIALRYDADVEVDASGELRVRGGGCRLTERAPVLYQLKNGHKVSVSGGFVKRGPKSVGFRAGEYDRSAELVIDPAIQFSRLFGGSSQTTITSVAVDPLNNVVSAGWTLAADLATGTAQVRSKSGGVDAFVAEFLPNGGTLVFCTFLGGSSEDRALGVAVDRSRNIYVTGWTSSSNFPLLHPLQSRLNGPRDAFVAKLNSSGQLIFSTYLGGAGIDTGNAIAADTTGAPIILGDTSSSNLPVLHAFQTKLRGPQNIFLAKLAADGTAYSFLTYLGGSGVDHAAALNLSISNKIFIGGSTYSPDFPVTAQAFQTHSAGGQDGFVAKFPADASYLGWSTYVGGSGGYAGLNEEVTGVYVDTFANVVAAGTTPSPDFPVTPSAFQTRFGGQTDGFVIKFSNAGSLLYSTFLGGMSTDQIHGLTQDFHGLPYVTGATSSGDFPSMRGLQGPHSGSLDAFVVKLNATLSSILFGTYLGGTGNDSGNSIAVDSVTSIVVAGQSASGDFPTTGTPSNLSPSLMPSFVSKLSPSFTLGVAYPYQGQQVFVSDPWHVSAYLASTVYGTATDIPVAGDWTGAGVRRIGVFRSGTWYLDTNGNGILDAADKVINFGQAGDIPVVGDWRGTGRIALGLFRKGTFILDLSGHLSGVPTGLTDASFTFGQAGDQPIVADWNGSGTTKVGVFRNGLWLVDYNGDRVYNSQDQAYTYGQAGDIPVVGDWDSSGSPSKIGVYRAGVWILDYDGDHVWTTPSTNELSIGFGFSGYVPLVF